MAFFCQDNGKFQIRLQTELFNDDGGSYVTVLQQFGEGKTLTEKLWYRELVEKTSAADFEKVWGTGNGRAYQAIAKVPWPGWTAYVVSLKHLMSLFQTDSFRTLKDLGTYREAFRLSIVLYPLLLWLMFRFLLWYFEPRGQRRVVWFAALFLSLFQVYGHNYFWAASSAHAWLFWVPSICLWIWGGRSARDYAILTCALLLTSLCHPIVFTVAVLLMAVSLGEGLAAGFAPRLFDFFSRRIQYALGFSLAAGLIARYYWLPLRWSGHEAYTLWWGRFHGVAFNTYFIPAISFLLALIFGLTRGAAEISQPARRAIVAAIGIAGGVFVSHLAAPFLSPLVNQNLGRYLEYYYTFLAAAAFELLWRKEQAKDLSVKMLAQVTSVFFVLTSFGQMLPIGLKIYERNGWVMHFSQPKLVKETSGFSYYEVSEISEFLSYFVNEFPKKAPLILKQKVGRYDPEEVKTLLREEHKAHAEPH